MNKLFKKINKISGIILFTVVLISSLLFKFHDNEKKDDNIISKKESLTEKEGTDDSKFNTNGRRELNEENDGEENKNYDEEYYKVIGIHSGNLLQNVQLQTWKEVLSRPTENEINDMPVNSWTCIGPYGIRRSSSSELYSGRVLDIEVEGSPSTRVASASGGLWKFTGFFPVPMSDQITSLVIGAFATNPGDANQIIVGTGEPYGSGGNGTGLWRTVNGGTTWTNPLMSPTPEWFYKIRYHPGSNNTIHVASNRGYYRSDNYGDTWTMYSGGNVTDLAIKFGNANIIYISKYGDGIYKSTNGGSNFSKVTTFPVASGTDFGRAAISICNAYSNYLYVSLVKQNGQSQGIYKTTNEGLSWQDISYRPGSLYADYHWGQGNYNNCIAVSPTNPDLVLLGAGSLLRTTNGGTSWTEYMEGGAGVENLHNDHHVIRWHSDGIRVWLGNDGGMAFSDDYGLTWSVVSNFLPITQFYDFDIGVSGTNIVVAGGTQDNAFPVSVNCKIDAAGTWNWKIKRDGSSSKIDKFNPLKIMGLTFNSANWLDKTTDGGANWTGCMSGLIDTVRISNIEDDGTNPIYCYIGHGNKIYKTTNFGDSWSQFTTYVFPSTVWRVNVSRFGAGGNIIYAIVYTNPPSQSNIVRVYDSGTWYDRGAGLPLAPLNYVAQHPSNNNKAYAITLDNYSSRKIFQTTNRGINWTDITGNLPGNLSVRDVVVNPANDNVLFAGSNMGMWKTTNGGVNWFRWINGMPIANQITRLKLIDSTSANGRFYVVAASFGRGIWIREGSGDDPIGIHSQNTNIPSKFELFQNYPNPFNPATTIEFSIPKNEFVVIKVFDISGREVGTIINSEMKTGTHEIKFDGSNLSSGIYFYTINAGDYKETKKMILVK